TCARRLARNLLMLPRIRVRHRSYGLDEAAAKSRQRGLREHTGAYGTANSRRSGVAGCDREPPCESGVFVSGFAATGNSCAVKAVRGGGKIRGSAHSVRGGADAGWLADQKNIAPDRNALVVVAGFAASDSDRSILSLSASLLGEGRFGTLH